MPIGALGLIAVHRFLPDDAISHAPPFDFIGCAMLSLCMVAFSMALDSPAQSHKLLVSGGLSPYLTQRIVARLVTLIGGAQLRHLTGAGHMLPLTHAAIINPEIVEHIARADEVAGMAVAAE